MIQTTECKPSSATLWSLSWQTMLPGNLTAMQFLLFVLPYSIKRHTEQCTHAEVSVMRGFWPFIQSWSPTHTFLLHLEFLNQCMVSIDLGTFFVSDQTDADTHTCISLHRASMHLRLQNKLSKTRISEGISYGGRGGCVCFCGWQMSRVGQGTVLTIGTTCTPLWEPPESCQSINI